jgi:hypothetical protein
LPGDLAEGVAAGLEVDERPVLVAEQASLELGAHGEAGVAAAAAGEVVVGAPAVDGARVRLALDAADAAGELAAADAGAGVGADRRREIVEQRRAGGELPARRGGRGDDGG